MRIYQPGHADPSCRSRGASNDGWVSSARWCSCSHSLLSWVALRSINNRRDDDEARRGKEVDTKEANNAVVMKFGPCGPPRYTPRATSTHTLALASHRQSSHRQLVFSHIRGNPSLPTSLSVGHLMNTVVVLSCDVSWLVVNSDQVYRSPSWESIDV